MQPFAIAGIQMGVSALHSNIQTMEHRLDTLMIIYPWVQMVLFSELAAFGPLIANAQPLPGPAEETFCHMAAKHKIWLIPGSLYEKKDNKIYNTAPIINPAGEVIARCRKMFPFRPYEVGVSAGEEFATFDVPEVGRFGVSICYDMWFPETSRTLATLGAEVLLHPSLTATVDRDVELSIARATAVTNQLYIFDINGVGAGGYGRSIVCGPEGLVHHQAGYGEEMIPIDIDLDRVRRSREQGIMRLGQVLKSFRDRSIDFEIYQPGAKSPYLDSLGPLKKPTRKGPDDKDAVEEGIPPKPPGNAQ
jgi:predicted amidohydrolase